MVVVVVVLLLETNQIYICSEKHESKQNGLTEISFGPGILLKACMHAESSMSLSFLQ